MTKSWTDTLDDVLHGATYVVNSVNPYLPLAVATPVKAVGVILQAADGVLHELTRDGVNVVAARETEAGRAANRASHLVGMREAIGAIFTRYYGVHGIEEPINAIMAEIVRRMP